MPSWAEYKEQARARGVLAMELYVAHSTPTGDMIMVRDNLPAHLNYQKQQEQAGTLVMAGPLSDPTGQNMEGAGMIIYRAASLDDARKLVENDPMHQSGARSFTLRRWLVNEGSLSFGVTLSDQRVRLSG